MNANDLGPLFQQPNEPHFLWIAVLIAATPAIGVALWGIARGRLAAGAILNGLVVMPTVAFLLGNVVVMQESKSVAFCGSCHETMSRIVESAHVADGSLASQHFRAGAVPASQGCYTCHSGYGLWGDMNAKLAGVNHMLHTVTGQYEFPLRMAHPFDITSCRGCHAMSAAFRAQPAHQDEGIQNMLLTGEMGCAGGCHAPAHPDEVLMGASAR